MRKILVLMMALVMTLSLAACGGADTSGTGAADWPYKDVTREQIEAISDVLAELVPLYNEAATAAKENGWEADETTVQELHVLYVLIETAKAGVADPSEYEGVTDMVTVVEQYQALLGAMPDMIAKVSKPYEK